MTERSALPPSRSTELLAKLDHAFVWHPFTPMEVWLDEDPLVIEAADGCELIDADGNRYLDGVSSLWVNVHGHRHPTLDAAIVAQLARMAHVTFLGLTHPGAVELAERLVALAPGQLSRVFYSENGAAAVEVALKMAFAYWRHLGEQRDRFVHLDLAYHGDTLGAVSVGGIERFHDAYRPLLFETASVPAPYCYRCPLGLELATCGLACADALDAVLTREGSRVAAVIVEPLVQGAAGIITAPGGHLARIAEITRRHGTLLIIDEVATGFGRTGTMFASEAEGVEPDLLCLGKGVTGGYLPLSATLATEQVFEAFLAPPEAHRTLFHGHSYSANPLACAAALANLEVFESEDTLAALEPKMALLGELLEPLEAHPHVGEVRRRGFMVGIELVRDRATKDAFPERLQVGAAVTRAARRRGAVIRPLGDVVVLMPPLSITPAQLEHLVAITTAAIEEACDEARSTLASECS